MSHKALMVVVLLGALSCSVQQAIAQDSRPVHGGAWPIQNGVKHQPTRGVAGAGEFSREQQEETDKLYEELMSNSFSATHHTGNARMR
jgi:hypothetical protein